MTVVLTKAVRCGVCGAPTGEGYPENEQPPVNARCSHCVGLNPLSGDDRAEGIGQENVGTPETDGTGPWSCENCGHTEVRYYETERCWRSSGHVAPERDDDDPDGVFYLTGPYVDTNDSETLESWVECANCGRRPENVEVVW